MIYRWILWMGTLVLMTPLLTTSCGKKTVSVPAILFLGDSLTAGFRLHSDQSYPALVQRRLHREGYSYRIINGGFTGDTTGKALARLDRIFQENKDIEIMIVFLGANDFFQEIAPDQVEDNLKRIFRMARSYNPGIKLYLVQFPRSGVMVPGYNMGYDDALTRGATDSHAQILPFFLDGILGVEELNQADHLHPNARGTIRVAENVYRILLREQIIRK